MSRCVEKLPHHTSKCNSSDGLQVFENDGKYDGYCFSCGEYVPDPYQDKGEGYKPQVALRSPEQIQEELDSLDNYPVVNLPDRRLTKETLDYFGIKVGVSEQDGKTPILHYYPYHKDGQRVAYKVRLIEGKKFWSVGPIKQADPLFNWHKAITTGARRLYITEGELDAASLYQVLKAREKGTKYESYDPAIVSLAHGSSSARKTISDMASSIREHFKEVVLVFDMDKQGQEAAQEVVQIFPTAKVAALPAKDANECLVGGFATALANAVLFKAAAPKNTRLVWGSSMIEAARQQASYGLSWPWEGLTKLTRGIRMGETYYLGAGVKMGKSELVNTIGAHLITEHDMKIFMAKPEEANRKTVQMVAGKVVGKIFHDPDIPFDYDAFDKAAAIIGDKLCMLSLYQHLGWETLKNDIIVAAGEGCKAIFIDPITNLTNGTNAGEANTVLQEIAQELAAMAKDLDIVIFIFCHLKAPDNGPPHERGGKVFSSQFSGSRAMMRSCNLMLGLEGNKDPDLPVEQRNLRKLVILEDREFGATGTINLYWDPATSLFNEIKDVK